MSKKIGTIPQEEYYKERQKRWIWIFPKIDRKLTSKQIVDLDIFCQIIFPHSVKKQGVAKVIIEAFIELNKPLYLRDLRNIVLDRINTYPVKCA